MSTTVSPDSSDSPDTTRIASDSKDMLSRKIEGILEKAERHAGDEESRYHLRQARQLLYMFYEQ